MIPAISVDQMREVDRIMVDDLHIELIQMMENAGRCLAHHVRSELGGDVRRRRIAVLAGSGGNGGGGLAAARRPGLWGAGVTVPPGQETDAGPRRPGAPVPVLQATRGPPQKPRPVLEADT